MKLTDEIRIEAPREAVFAALNDPEILKRAIPGCQELERVSETEMTATVQAKVGPVRAKFTGAVTLADVNPPEGYTISGEGKGGAAGFAKGGAKVSLEDDGGATVLRYEVDAEVGGKLAQVGARLIEGTSKKLAGEFFETFSELVGDAGATAAPAPTAAAAPAVAPGEPPLLYAEALAVIAILAAGFLAG
ncbi:MAG: carbon monoxide dehydrogenase subunit G [Magnetovibrio sp.]|nr:carbon monoxide dehydrogenase subunit G [Magnetovibrio sp.]